MTQPHVYATGTCFGPRLFDTLLLILSLLRKIKTEPAHTNLFRRDSQERFGYSVVIFVSIASGVNLLWVGPAIRCLLRVVRQYNFAPVSTTSFPGTHNPQTSSGCWLQSSTLPSKLAVC